MKKQDIKQVNVPIASLRREPNNDSELETQCLFGEEVRIFSQKIIGFYVRQKVIITKAGSKNT